MMQTRSARAVLAVILIAACSDSATGPKGTALAIVTQPSATAQTMIPLQTQPVVQVVDANGTPVKKSGVNVTVTATSTAGQVMSGGSATTDANGTATFTTLMLGAADGAVGATTLSFVATGLTNATATLQLECAHPTITVGANIADSLSAGDCKRVPPSSAVGAFYKLYELTVAEPTKAIELVSTASFSQALLLRGATEPSVFFGQGTQLPGTIDFKAYVPPGTHSVLLDATSVGLTGTFSLAINELPEDESICDEAMFVSPLSTSQTLRAACTDDAGNTGDFFFFSLPDGAAVNVTMTSTDFAPDVTVWEFVPDQVVVGTGALSGSASTASAVNNTGDIADYYIFAGSNTGSGIGAYTLSATVSSTAVATVRSGASQRVKVLGPVHGRRPASRPRPPFVIQ
jgi:hypothetical protein